MSRPAAIFLTIPASALAICLALLGLETLRSNLLGWFLLVIGVAYPAGGVIYYFLRHESFWGTGHSEKAALEEKNDNSFWAILPGFLVVFFASPLEWLRLPALLPRSTWMQAAGLALILAAVVLRIWARFHIRGLYTGHVEVLADQRLVQTGPYWAIRHPGYTGFLLMALGLAIGYSSWIALAAIPLLLLPGFVYRIRVEERLLTERFGKQFQDYAHTTKALIPWIW